MPEFGIDLDDDWLDAELLADDETTDKQWRRNSLNGMGVTEALMGIPKYGKSLLSVPMDSHRLMVRHVKQRGTTLAVFLRQAVGMLLLAEGVPRDQLNDFLGPQQ